MHHQRSCTCCAASPIMLPATTLVPDHLVLSLWFSWPRCNPPHVSIALVAFTHYQCVHVGLCGCVCMCGCVHVFLSQPGDSEVMYVGVYPLEIGCLLTPKLRLGRVWPRAGFGRSITRSMPMKQPALQKRAHVAGGNKPSNTGGVLDGT